jgi:hypothetical protein
MSDLKSLLEKPLPNKAFSERNPETVKNTHFFEKNVFFSHLLSKQGDVLSYKMIARDLLGCTGPFDRLRAGCWGLPPEGTACGTLRVKHFAKRGFEFFLLPSRVSVPPQRHSPQG